MRLFQVHNGTFVIGLICLIYSLLSILGGAGFFYTVNVNENDTGGMPFPEFAREFAKYAYFYTIGSLIESVILLCTSILLIWGNRARKPILYWPFMIYQIISLLISFARLAVIVYVLINTLINESDKAKEQHEQRILAISFLSFLLTILLCLQIYFLWVVIRGRNFLVEERKIQKSVVNHYNPYHSGGTLVDQPYYQYHRQWDPNQRSSNTGSYVYY